MLHWVRIAGLSAMLAAGVSAYGEPASVPSPGKPFQDRLPQASADMTSPACLSETWPYLTRECTGTWAAGDSQAVRVITFEVREGPNSSTLVRVPQTTVAAR
jgi:hypothetical protein